MRSPDTVEQVWRVALRAAVGYSDAVPAARPVFDQARVVVHHLSVRQRRPDNAGCLVPRICQSRDLQPRGLSLADDRL
jgi:hypothetical protein